MKRYYIWLYTCLLFLCSCNTAGILSVNSVSYQSLRTDFAQSDTIPNDAKIAVEYFFNKDGVMQPVIYNLTSDVLVVDQTKSFVIMPDGSSISYYDPTVYTSTTGTYDSFTTGSSFNLGGVTSALGIGGTIGLLASSTTIGSSHTEGYLRQNSVTKSDQPHIHIGPKGSVAMSKSFSIPGLGYSAISGSDFVDIAPKASKLKFSVCVTYSVDDEKTYEKLVTNFYVNSHITIPVYNKKVSEAFYKIYDMKPDALVENMYIFMMPNNIKSVSYGVSGDFIHNDEVYDTYIHGSLIDYK